MFPRLKPTKNAEAQMLKTIEGATLRFSRIGLGNGERPSIDFEDITQMQNLVCFGNLTSYERNGTNAIIHWQLDCASVENTFDWTEYALFALDENDNEFLFSYSYNEGTPQPISSVNSESLVMLENDINICIGDAEHVSAIIGEYSAYASKETVEEHLNNKDNPHNVTADQIGLEHVENVSVNNAMPTFTESEIMENIQSGDNTSTLWGKAKKLFSTLITHISNKNNPHGITTEKINAAKSSHKHSTTDINDGVLSVSRGGTGTSDLNSFLKKLVSDKSIILSNNRFLKGQTTTGSSHNLIGMNNQNEVSVGNDEANIMHIHCGPGGEFCFRWIVGSLYKYFHITNSSSIYCDQIDLASGRQSDSGANLGTSTYRFNTVYAKTALNTSDKKLKENIKPYLLGKALLEKISYKEFNFIGDEEKRVGVIAQEIFKVCQDLGIHNSSIYNASVKDNDADKHPELENLSDDEIIKYKDSELSWNVDYQQLTNCLLSGFQNYMRETEQRISKLENIIGGNDNYGI